MNHHRAVTYNGYQTQDENGMVVFVEDGVKNNDHPANRVAARSPPVTDTVHWQAGVAAGI